MKTKPAEGTSELESISVFELSPTATPANLTMSLYQKAAPKESAMGKKIDELCKALSDLEDLSDEEKSALTKAFSKVSKGSHSPPAGSPEARASFAQMRRDGTLDEEDEKSAKKTAKKSAAEELIEKLSAEQKSEFEALQKSQADQIELLKKSVEDAKAETLAIQKARAEEAKEARRVTLVAKAAKEFPHVPLKADDIGQLLQLSDQDPAMAKLVNDLLGSTQAALAKSDLFRSVGSSAARSGASSEQRIEALISERRQSVQKSTGEKLSYAKAYTAVIEENPGLYADFERERAQAVSQAFPGSEE